MQIVIDIDEDFESDIFHISDVDVADILYKIRNGVVLPLKHGRLIDADSLIKQTTEQLCEKCDRRRGMKDGKLTKRFIYEIGDAPCRACEIGDMHDYLEDAPTILEATKGDAE